MYIILRNALRDFSNRNGKAPSVLLVGFGVYSQLRMEMRQLRGFDLGENKTFDGIPLRSSPDIYTNAYEVY